MTTNNISGTKPLKSHSITHDNLFYPTTYFITWPRSGWIHTRGSISSPTEHPNHSEFLQVIRIQYRWKARWYRCLGFTVTVVHNDRLNGPSDLQKKTHMDKCGTSTIKQFRQYKITYFISQFASVVTINFWIHINICTCNFLSHLFSQFKLWHHVNFSSPTKSASCSANIGPW